jgi:hypothetical protein
MELAHFFVDIAKLSAIKLANPSRMGRIDTTAARSGDLHFFARRQVL